MHVGNEVVDDCIFLEVIKTKGARIGIAGSDIKLARLSGTRFEDDPWFLFHHIKPQLALIDLRLAGRVIVQFEIEG